MIKKLLSSLLCLAILLSPVMGYAKAIGQNVVYRATVTGLTISAVDGTALVDNLPATVAATYADGTNEIQIFDSAGRMLKGILKAVGTTGTWDTTLITNGTFDADTSGWTTVRCTAASSFPAGGGVSGDYLILTRTGSVSYVWQNVTGLAVGGLYRIISYVKSGSSGVDAYTVGLESFGDGSLITATIDSGISSASWAQKSKYWTSDRTQLSAVLIKDSNVAGTMFFDEFALQKGLTPSNLGATIVSTKGGATYNFSYKNASFAYNAASYKVQIVKKRGP